MQQQLSDRLTVAKKIALEAGAITLRYFCQDNYQVELKSDDSPVTVADREAELHLRQSIGEMFPADAILGEEFPDKPGESGFRWILDPIDGTKSFISGVPFYGTLIGVEHEGQSVVGVIHLPGLAETAYAARGQGAWHVRGKEPPKPARVSNKSKLSAGLFLTSDVRGFAEIGQADAYTRLQNAARIARTWGDCYGYVLVATGRAEVMVDPKMNVWDCAALQPILEEAGGTFTDWAGTSTIHGGNGIATNGKILDEVMRLVRG
jgi:histidinol-phosphatase